jgi:peptidoglycan/LPS O-acetylase OafA/YrhL
MQPSIYRSKGINVAISFFAFVVVNSVMQTVPPPSVSPSMQEKLTTLQLIRFIAASVVVIFHAERNADWLASRHGHDYHHMGLGGGFGVYLFFILSGFLMTRIVQQSDGTPRAAGKFLTTRIIRIAPIYWLFTLVMIIMTLVLQRLGSGKSLPAISAEAILKAFLFIPYIGRDNDHSPILGQGWTLNHEVLFYFLLGISLTRGKSIALAITAAAIAGGAILANLTSLPVAFDLWFRPVSLLFLVGMSIAQVRKVQYFDSTVGCMLTATLLTVACVLNSKYSFNQLALTAWAVVIFFVLTTTREPEPPSLLYRALVYLGDISFSTYLVHTFVIYLLSWWWDGFMRDAALSIFVVLAFAISQFFAHFIYRHIERPLVNFAHVRATRFIL